MLSQFYVTLLQILSYALFGTEKPKLNDIDIKALLDEARAQSVFSLVFLSVQDTASKYLTEKQFNYYNNLYMSDLVINVQNHENHTEIDKIMKDAEIPYCIIKGAASASYYPEPSLRAMGDVDFVVRESDIEKAMQAVESVGYTSDDTEFKGKHIAYTRKPFGILELHKSVNGIPDGKIGKKIEKDISNIYDTAVEISDNAHCLIPNEYYHGLIMLLHTISHLTGEGVGLRHLCDWAVFVNSFGVGEFKSLFEVKLKSYGIWRFAQMFTLTCTEYLGVKKQPWAEILYTDEDISKDDIEALLADILSGGNFGTKDMNRYREIKYISGGQNSVDHGGIISQMFKSLNRKVYSNYKLIDRYKILLPFGWVIEGAKYIKLLATGKRKSSNTKEMLKEADKRKKLYNKMELFLK